MAVIVAEAPYTLLLPIVYEVSDVSYCSLGHPVILSVNAHNDVHDLNPLILLTLSAIANSPSGVQSLSPSCL